MPLLCPVPQQGSLALLVPSQPSLSTSGLPPPSCRGPASRASATGSVGDASGKRQSSRVAGTRRLPGGCLWPLTPASAGLPTAPAPQDLPQPGQAARQRHSPDGAPEGPDQEAPRSPQQSSQQRTGRRTQAAVPACDRSCGHLQAPELQPSPQLRPLPSRSVGSVKASAEPPKARGLLAISPSTLHARATC